MQPAELARWLENRLVGARAREEWRTLVAGSFEAILDRRLDALVPIEAAEPFLRALLSPERVLDLVRPLVRLHLPLLVAQARLDDRPIGRFVPPEARAKILDLVSRKGLIHDAWIRQIFAQRAAEELLADTIYRALRDFSAIVPRIIQSVTPSAIGKLAKLGGKATGGMGQRMVEEVERRLEVEIKRFLEIGSRKALDGAAAFAVSHVDDPVSVESRRNVAGFVLDQSGAFHVQAMSDELIEAAGEIEGLIARHVAEQEETKKILSDVLERIRAEHGGKPVRQFLTDIGVDGPPPYDEWAALTWPAVEAILAAPAVKAWIAGLAEEIAALFDAP